MNSEPEAAGKRENGKTRKRDGDSTVLLSEGKVGLAFSLAFSVFSLCALCSLWGLLAANASGAEVEIELQPEVAISTRQIYLRDIARIQTDDPALQRKLEAVMLGLAYTTERPRIITDFDVKSRMARQGLDADAFTFIGARAVVRYHAITITPEQILASARQFYLEQIGGENVGKAFQIEPRAPIRPMLVPDADVELRFVPINGDLWKGTLEVQAYYRGSEGAGRRGSGGASASALIPNPQPLTPAFPAHCSIGISKPSSRSTLRPRIRNVGLMRSMTS